MRKRGSLPFTDGIADSLIGRSDKTGFSLFTAIVLADCFTQPEGIVSIRSSEEAGCQCEKTGSQNGFQYPWVHEAGEQRSQNRDRNGYHEKTESETIIYEAPGRIGIDAAGKAEDFDGEPCPDGHIGRETKDIEFLRRQKPSSTR
jgi:hypothetical protein